MATNTITVTNTAIDISAVNTAVRKHANLLTTIQQEEASDILQHFTPMPAVRDSITFGRTLLGQISRKYTGEFKGQVARGKVVPRTLKVYPCVMEMSDEPESYRRAYISEVAGGLTKHPFEVWLNNWGVKSASKELHDAFLSAKYDPSDSKTSLSDAFDGPLTIIQASITSKEISVAEGNLIATGAMTAADVGEKLLAMWRKLPNAFRRQKVKMMISVDLGDMYDDWLEAQGTYIVGSEAEEAGAKFLRGTGRKVELVRMSGVPSGMSQFVWITLKENQYYGFDQPSDMSTLTAFASGNPYLYTAAGKYVFGTQFVTFNKYVFACNERGMTLPAETAS